ncbi:MAG: hypothetical protein ABIV13_02260 [Fimbriimonadales bacterium]
MMKEWIDKLANEEALSQAEQSQLNAALASQDESGLPSMVGALPRYDAPQGVAEGFENSLRRRGVLRVASGFGAFAAASLAMFFVLNVQESPAPVVEELSADSLFDWHQEAVATSVLPGDGANLAAFSQVARDGDKK